MKQILIATAMMLPILCEAKSTISYLADGVTFFEIEEKCRLTTNTYAFLSPDAKTQASLLANGGTASDLTFPDINGNPVAYDYWTIQSESLPPTLNAKAKFVTPTCADNRKNLHYSILKISPTDFNGEVDLALPGQKLGDQAPLSAIHKQYKSLATLNGGFFVVSDAQGVKGDPAGLTVVDGELISDAVSHRPGLILQSDASPAWQIVADITNRIQLHVNGNVLPISGVNRPYGKVMNCGYNGIVAAHDMLCQSQDTALIFNRYFADFGSLTSLEGFMPYIYRRQTLTPVTNIPASLAENEWLVLVKQDVLLLSKPVAAELSFAILGNGSPISISNKTSIVTGGPTLLIEGKQAGHIWDNQGWHIGTPPSAIQATDDRDLMANQSLSRAEFYYNWILSAHPRSAVGVTAKNELLLLAVYGRQPGYSAGVNMYELTQLLKKHGAINAFNLDGGGSTSMMVNDKLTGTPSDSQGERAISEAIVVLPDSKR